MQLKEAKRAIKESLTYILASENSLMHSYIQNFLKNAKMKSCTLFNNMKDAKHF